MYQVEGFEFETKEAAAEAKREADGIRYIMAQTRMDDPNTVLRLYNKLILKEVFHTPVGFQFLNELQEYLTTSPSIRAEDIRPIPVFHDTVSTQVPSRSEKKEAAQEKRKTREIDKKLNDTTRQVNQSKRKQRDRKNYKTAYHNSMIVNGILAAIIVGMFLITYLSGNNVNILNYENALIDKYELWETQLNEREEAILLREKELGMDQGEE